MFFLSAKLYWYEQWLREDVSIQGTEKLELQHLYRTMDFLEGNKASIEEAIYFSIARLSSGGDGEGRDDHRNLETVAFRPTFRSLDRRRDF